MKKLLAGLWLLLCAVHAAAQSFPTKPLRVICAFPPGGPVDVIARAIARELQAQLGQPVVVENRPGASGNIGAEAAAKSPPDGSTLLINWNSLHAISPVLYRQLNYDPNKDLIPVTQLVSFRQVLVVNAGSAVNSVRELVAEAKAHPGKLTYASTGNGTVSHMAGVMFTQLMGIDAVHVPYKGSAPAMTDLMAGQVTLMFDHIPSVLPQITAGKLRALATSGPVRDAKLPNVPTMQEAGVAGFDTSAWFGVAVAAGTPREVVQRINAEVIKGSRAPEFTEAMAKLGYDVVTTSPERTAAILKTEIDLWGPIVKASGARVD